MNTNDKTNDNDNDRENIRPPDRVFCEKLIDDDVSNDIFHLNLPPYNANTNTNALPKLKRHITNTWHIQKTDDNRFLSVPVFKEEDGEEVKSEDITWLYDSILNNSDNNDNITMDEYDDDYDYDLEKAIQESFNQYNLENKNTLLPLIKSENESEPQTQITEIELKKKNILPIFKSKIQRLIYFDKQLKEIYELIKPIINLYETGDLNYHETDNVTYDKIFNTLRSLRIPKEEWSILETIFIKQLN
jgi:hypothetical protein